MLSRIDRIELYNFKSYAGRVTIGPFKDFTCIVGPNGSGKSNLMDALCFVLSSNPTATLRGRDVTDFIHRGAQEKECAVTVVLRRTPTSNTEDGKNSNEGIANGNNRVNATSEMFFTRAVDHKGGITHMIDGSTVRECQFFSAMEKFKVSARVNDFFVFQHDVEAVAQKKARGLTEMLEQVSGSGELKEEYNRCKKAHDLANQELTTASIEKRDAVTAINQMRFHRKEVEKYDEVSKRMIDERRDEALVQLLYVESNLEKQKRELHAFEEKLYALETTIVSDEDIRNMKREYAAKHRTYLEELKKNRKDVELLREKHNTLERIKTSMTHLKRKREVQQHEFDALMKTQKTQSREMGRLEEQLQQQRALLSAFEERCKKEDREKTTLSGALDPKQLSEYHQLRKEAECETVVLRQQLERAKRQQQSLIEGKRQCDIALENVRSQKEELERGIQRSNDRVMELQHRAKDLHGTVEELNQNTTQKKADLMHAERMNREREEELAKVQEQLHELRFIKENDKRDSRMAEALQALRALHGIRGRLVDLCTITNNKYRHAVTVAFGKNLEAVVVDTTEVAIACVRYLKEQRLPPMTFLPLDSVQGKGVDDRLRTFGGTCKPVVDVIRYDMVIEPAVRYALGQTLVCDGMVEAKRVAYFRGDGERFKVVTEDGTVLLRNGAVQGGLASIQSRARKWDEKRYEDLRMARERLLSDAASGSEAEMARMQCELRDMDARLDFTRGRIKTVEAEMQATIHRVPNMEREMAKQETEERAIKERRAAYEVELSRCQDEVRETWTSITQVEERIFAEFQQRVNISNLVELESREAQGIKEQAVQRQQMQLLVHKLEMSLEAEQKRIGVRSVDDLRGVCARLDDEIKQCERDLMTYSEIVKTSEIKLADSKVSLGEKKEQLDRLELAIRQQSRTSEQELGKLAQARRGITALQAACDTLRQQRLNIVRRCQMNEIVLPLKPVDVCAANRQELVELDTLNFSEPFALVDEFAVVGPVEGQQQQESKRQQARSHLPASIKTAELVVDFSGLSQTQRQAASSKEQLAAYRQSVETLLESLQRVAESLVPNLRAVARLGTSEEKLRTSSALLEESREKAKKAYTEFTRVKELRMQRFMETFERIAEHVDRVYRELTLSTRAHAVHGSAYLSLEDAEEPYLAGTKYHATPPMKRYMPMELLSGGERTMAALALLFAVHAVSPTPFFVLDEVDAALDAGNVEKLANYMRTNCDKTQFIVISLKDQLYHVADLLVGVLKDKQRGSSSILTMDLSGYPF